MRTTIKTIDGEVLTSISDGVPASKEIKIRSCGETFEVIEIVHDYDHGGVVQVLYVHSSRSTFQQQLSELEQRAAQQAFLSDLHQVVHQVLNVPSDIKQPLDDESYQALSHIAYRVASDLTGSHSTPSNRYGYALSGLCGGYEEELKLTSNQSHCFGKALVQLHAVLSKHKVRFSVQGVKLDLIAHAEQQKTHSASSCMKFC